MRWRYVIDGSAGSDSSNGVQHFMSLQEEKEEEEEEKKEEDVCNHSVCCLFNLHPCRTPSHKH